MNKLRGFWNSKEARKVSPVVSRSDLVAERNAAVTVRSSADLRPHERNAPLVTLSRAKPDSRVHCYRPDGTRYAVVAPSQWVQMRKARTLESWLDRERASGVVIATA